MTEQETIKKVSRQYKWQLKQRSLGNCPTCGQKTARGYVLCKKHVLAARKRARALYKPKRKYRIPF